jgi:septin family protein
MFSIIKMVKFLLLCGYRGTGKDTFVNDLLYRKENWCVYTKNMDNIDEVYKPRSRLGLADSVKKEVAKLCGLPISVSQIDNLKDVMMISGRKLREYLIEQTGRKALENKFYWEEEAMKEVEEDDDYVISDFRYKRTLEYFKDKCLTARLFRMEVKIPIEKEKTEHILDDLETDFLLLPVDNHEEQFKKCCDTFKQYSEYKLIYNPKKV